MRSATILVCAAMLSVALLSGNVGALDTLQSVDLAKTDARALAVGFRVSKVIGSDVVNDSDETIGEINDVLVSSDGKQPYAVLSVGGFLGMGARLIVVPYASLAFSGEKVTMLGSTKNGLEVLPEFKFATE